LFFVNKNPGGKTIWQHWHDRTQIEQKLMKRSVQSLFLIGFVFVAGAMIVPYCPDAAAQPVAATSGSADDLRPLNAMPDEVAEGMRLAATSCSGCHGANGINTNPGVPNLAGQRAAYLYIELRAYKSGARGDSAMNNAVKFLSDDALVKVAAYFASLDPPTAPAAAAGPANFDPVQAGKTVATAACAGCHGNTGISQIPGIPSLVGLDPKYLVEAIKAYKNGQRKNDTMKSMLASVGDGAMNNIATFYALQKPERAKSPAAGDPAAGKEASASCGGCHGEQGVSASPATPSLAGQDAQYLAVALQAYKSGARADETMKGMVAALDDKAMKNLAAYYAALEPKSPNVRKPLTTEEWTQRCDRCHGLNGNSTDPRLPMLASQRVDYLEKVLHDYKTGARKSPQMAAMADVLTEQDIEGLAAHYARQRARAVVFVPQPSK
jgi:cytochrome c553